MPAAFQGHAKRSSVIVRLVPLLGNIFQDRICSYICNLGLGISVTLYSSSSSSCVWAACALRARGAAGTAGADVEAFGWETPRAGWDGCPDPSSRVPARCFLSGLPTAAASSDRFCGKKEGGARPPEGRVASPPNIMLGGEVAALRLGDFGSGEAVPSGSADR